MSQAEKHLLKASKAQRPCKVWQSNGRSKNIDIKIEGKARAYVLGVLDTLLQVQIQKYRFSLGYCLLLKK